MPELNHLVIGLGGTGCSVVSDLHRRLFAECIKHKRNNGDSMDTGAGGRPDVYEFDQRIGSELWKMRVATLSVDSDEAELRGRSENCSVSGEQITLRDTETYLLNASEIEHMLNNLHLHPGVKPWVEQDMQFFEEYNNSKQHPTDCYQNRRFGRLALASGNNIQGLLGKVDHRLRALHEHDSHEVTLHLCASLAGDTGSGILIDMIAQLRKHLSLSVRNFPIYLYLFITGSEAETDTGTFHAKQYATLQELNALKRGYYQPWDISHKTESVRIRVNNSFKLCFLVSEMSDSGEWMPLRDQTRLIGDYLFQNFARQPGLTRSGSWNAFGIGGWNRPLFDSLPEDTRDNSSGRSTSFATVGINRMRIPEDEIHKKLALTLARPGILALVYGTWDGTMGFINMPGSCFDCEKFVQDSLSKWSFTALQLCLDDNSEAPPYKKEWKDVSDNLRYEAIKTTTEFRQWTELHRAKMEDHCQNGFRNMGLDNFFELKTEDSKMADRARELVGGLERSMLEGWLFGKEHFITDNLAVMVSTLRGQIERFQQAFKERQTALVTEKEKQTNLRDYNDGELQNVGTATAYLTKKHHDIFHAYCEASRVLYTLQTEERAASYAIGLIDKILPLLDGLRGRVEGVDTLFKKLADEWTEESSALLKKPDKGDAKATDADPDCYFDYDEIAQTIKILIHDKQAVDLQSRAFRRLLDQQRGQTHDFDFVTRSLYIEAKRNRVTGSLRNQMERVSYAAGGDMHRVYENNCEAGFKPILNQNIIEKLYDDNDGLVTDELRFEKLKELITSASVALNFDYAAEPVEGFRDSPLRQSTVLIPHCRAISEGQLRDQLIREFEVIRGNHAQETEIHDVLEEVNSSEIVCISTAFFFPLRMVQPVVELKKRFEAKLKEDERRTLFLHFGESHQPGLPDLMIKADSELRKDALPYLVLAAQTSLIHVIPGDSQDDWEVMLGERDGYGRVNDGTYLGLKCSPEDRKRSIVQHSLPEGSFKLPIELLVLWHSQSMLETRAIPILKSTTLKRARVLLGSDSGRATLFDSLATRARWVADSCRMTDNPFGGLYNDATQEAVLILESLR